jgi:hypothetical protein
MYKYKIQQVFAQPFVIDPGTVRFGEGEGVQILESILPWKGGHKTYIAPQVQLCCVFGESEQAE